MENATVYPLNTQPTEHLAHEIKGSLDVIHIWKTIQGEGPLVGTPAIFVRLAGCNLQCFGCDTEYTKNRKVLTEDELITQVLQLSNDLVPNLIVLTGGEPFRQNINQLIRKVIKAGLKIQIETNGVINPFTSGIMPAASFMNEWSNGVFSIVCSPKTPKIGLPIGRIDALKYIISTQDGISREDGLPLGVLGLDISPFRPLMLRRWVDQGRIFIQPMDVGNATEAQRILNQANTFAAIQSCLKYGYRLSLQTHKLLGLE